MLSSHSAGIQKPCENSRGLLKPELPRQQNRKKIYAVSISWDIHVYQPPTLWVRGQETSDPEGRRLGPPYLTLFPHSIPNQV